jgi:hypothetical protein
LISSQTFDKDPFRNKNTAKPHIETIIRADSNNYASPHTSVYYAINNINRFINYIMFRIELEELLRFNKASAVTLTYHMSKIYRP